MKTPIPHHKFPTVYLVDDQIAYVTDNERDAEALSCNTECFVVVDRKLFAVSPSRLSASVDQTPEAPKTPRRSNVRGVLNALDTSDTQVVWESRTPNGIQDALGAQGVSGSSDIYTADL